MCLLQKWYFAILTFYSSLLPLHFTSSSLSSAAYNDKLLEAFNLWLRRLHRFSKPFLFHLNLSRRVNERPSRAHIALHSVTMMGWWLRKWAGEWRVREVDKMFEFHICVYSLLLIALFQPIWTRSMTPSIILPSHFLATCIAHKYPLLGLGQWAAAAALSSYARTLNISLMKAVHAKDWRQCEVIIKVNSTLILLWRGNSPLLRRSIDWKTSSEILWIPLHVWAERRSLHVCGESSENTGDG